MGAWGGGIYASDFAVDLRGTIKGVLRAPLSDDEVAAEIWNAHGAGASDIEALDYWLVLADQFERRGVPHKEVFERARAIIAGGEDLAALKELAADPGTIASRRRETAQLMERLRRPRPARQRKTLSKPQPLLLQQGEGLTWPTDKGNSIDPYKREGLLRKPGGFTQDGWGFGIVAEAGHMFHVVAYYVVQVLKWRRREKPSLELAVHCPRSAYYFGTLTKRELQWFKVERLGQVPPEGMVSPPAPDWVRRNGRDSVLRNISVTQAFGLDGWKVWSSEIKFGYPAPSGTPLDPDDKDPPFDFEDP